MEEHAGELRADVFRVVAVEERRRLERRHGVDVHVQVRVSRDVDVAAAPLDGNAAKASSVVPGASVFGIATP